MADALAEELRVPDALIGRDVAAVRDRDRKPDLRRVARRQPMYVNCAVGGSKSARWFDFVSVNQNCPCALKRSVWG
jgi:hypothetical protein